MQCSDPKCREEPAQRPGARVSNGQGCGVEGKRTGEKGEGVTLTWSKGVEVGTRTTDLALKDLQWIRYEESREKRGLETIKIGQPGGKSIYWRGVTILHIGSLRAAFPPCWHAIISSRVEKGCMELYRLSGTCW